MATSMRALAVAGFVLASQAAAAAGEEMTERQAVETFIAESALARAVPLAERAAAAAGKAAARFPDPQIAVEVEEAAGVRDRFVTIEQTLAVSGRRSIMRESAATAASAAGHAARAELIDGIASVRTAFHDVLFAERTLSLVREGAGRLARIVEILEAREREGEGAGYDLLRIEQELADAEIGVMHAEAEVVAARARFGAHFEPERRMEEVDLGAGPGPLRPLPDVETAITAALAARADLASIRREAAVHELARRAALRRGVPEPTLTAGTKRTDDGGVADRGFVVAIRVPLPLFNRGRQEAARAAADSARAGLVADRLERGIRAEVVGAIARERAAREAARRSHESAVTRAAALRQIAEVAYEEGEMGILELIDALRTSLASERRALEARNEATRTEIETDRVTGVGGFS